ncbi:T9SS type B sorting domain-containing protein [Flavobacterium poyangense]
MITIEDTSKPVFAGDLPKDATVSCDAVPAPAQLVVSDDCTLDLPVVFSETKSDIQNQCNSNYTLTRTWTATDCSGNTTSYVQIITVRDTTAPTGTVPADVTGLESIVSIPTGNPQDVTNVSDNCDSNVTITITDTHNGGSGCEGSAYILTRTYTLTDCAGNKTELVQTFTVENKVSVSGIATNATCLGAADGAIAITSSPGATVVIRNQNNEIVGNTNLPAGTYTLTATSPVNNENQTCTATATVVITQPDYKVKISGQIINVDTNTPIANVPVTLIPQGTTTGPILLRITGADGIYNFTGVPVGSYLVQVQDANLGSVQQLYPIDSSLFYTTLEECKFQVHNFEYGSSTLPVLGDYVWYDTNGNGIQDEWYDANNDGIVTKNIPDGNGAIDYSKWEWIDFNGDGSFAGPQNVGELNEGGFGNALTPNVIIDGPNGYHKEIIVGISGYWRDRPETANPNGDYTIKLVRDANLDAVATALGATGLVKVIPSADKKVTSKLSQAQLHNACQTTSPSSYIVTITPQDLIHLDADFGVNCKMLRDIVANDDTAGPFPSVNQITPNVLNVLPNDTIEGVVVQPSDVTITTVTPNAFLQLNSDGSINILPNAPIGTLTLVYQICEADNSNNCDTATVTLTIVAPPAIIATDDTYSNIGCNTFGLVGNVLDNDLIGQVKATVELVNFTLLSDTGNNNNAKTDPNITIDASGNVTVSSLTPAGTYTYNYQICIKAIPDICDTATVTITVLPKDVTSITGKACKSDSTPINLNTLLPENTPLTGTWIDTGNSNALQGNILNSFGLAVGSYTFEYAIADETCPRSIVLTMEINDDCSVLACQNVVIHNAFSPNGDGRNDYFQIDNIDQTSCYPENTVEIYNRWGVLVFDTSNYNNATNAFDGTSRGRTTIKQSDGLPTGTYFYIITYKSLDGNNVVQNHKESGYLYLSR